MLSDLCSCLITRQAIVCQSLLQLLHRLLARPISLSDSERRSIAGFYLYLLLQDAIVVSLPTFWWGKQGVAMLGPAGTQVGPFESQVGGVNRVDSCVLYHSQALSTITFILHTLTVTWRADCVCDSHAPPPGSAHPFASPRLLCPQSGQACVPGAGQVGRRPRGT